MRSLSARVPKQLLTAIEDSRVACIEQFLKSQFRHMKARAPFRGIFGTALLPVGRWEIIIFHSVGAYFRPLCADWPVPNDSLTTACVAFPC